MSSAAEVLKKAREMKSAFIPMGGQQQPPAGAPPQGGGQPPAGGPPMDPSMQGGQPPAPAGGAPAGGQYPPELLQAAQQLGIPVGPDGVPVDPQSGQPIPPEALMQIVEQMMAQGGGAPAGGPPPQGGAGAPPPPEGGMPPADPQTNMQGLMQMQSAVEQLAAALDAVKQENQQIKTELSNQINTFQKSVSELQGQNKILMELLQAPAAPEMPMGAPQPGMM